MTNLSHSFSLSEPEPLNNRCQKTLSTLAQKLALDLCFQKKIMSALPLRRKAGHFLPEVRRKTLQFSPLMRDRTEGEREGERGREKKEQTRQRNFSLSAFSFLCLTEIPPRGSGLHFRHIWRFLKLSSS